ncbi:MAG: polysaccharide biosynthesis/export family protein [bacterium]
MHSTFNIRSFHTWAKILLIAVLLAVFSCSHAYPEELGNDYLIGPEDVLQVTVWKNEDLSGRVAVSLDGYINFHLIGKQKAAGLTTAELAARITEKLANGYIINPQVTVQVLEYKSQKLTIIGEASKPGTYYLTKRTTLIEAISMAGGLTADAGREVVIVRPKRVEERRSITPSNQAEVGEQIRVDIRSALEGDLSQNIYVQNGDSIFIPQAESFFIMGKVKNPGKYILERGTTVRKAISIGGGATEKAAMGRTRVVRIIDGKETEKRIGLDELVQSNDTIVVPECLF